MSGWVAVSRSDLLRALAGAPDCEAAGLAACLGYELAEKVEEEETSLPQFRLEDPSGVVTTDPASDTGLARLPEQAPYRFLVPLEGRFHADKPMGSLSDFFDASQSISDEALARKGDVAPLREAPLIPWSRLGPFMRKALGSMRRSGEVDIPKYVGQLSRLAVDSEIPRLQWSGWSSQAIVLMDFATRLEVFWPDLRWLKRHLRDHGSKRDFSFVDCEGGPPARRLWGRFSPQIPLLVASDMGCLDEDGHAESTEAWLRFGRYLRRRGVDAVALLPCPRNRWDRRLSRVWRCACWDRGPRLPRERSGLRPMSGSGDKSLHCLERLLDSLSPAVRIEGALLRRARLLLAGGCDVGTEYDVWQSKEMASRSGVLGFRGDYAQARRERFREQAGQRREAFYRLLQRGHRSCSDLLQAELAVHLMDAGMAMPREQRERIETLLQRSFNRIARSGAEISEIDRYTLADWFIPFFRRLSQASRSSREGVSATLALIHYHEQQPVVDLPAGTDKEVYERVRDSLFGQLAEAVRWTVLWDGARVHLRKQELKARPGSSLGYPLGMIESQVKRLGLEFVEIESTNSRYRFLEQEGPSETLALPSVDCLRLSSDRSELMLRSLPRPDWAERMGYDRFGLYAEFAVKGVGFRLRWIPPGRFLMGSPESERGREADETWREVTVSEGYWLAESPTTEAQWGALMADSQGGSQGGRLPVSGVSWEGCLSFCRALEKAMADAETGQLRLCFSLPSEAQWEYACRAGTHTAFNDGSDCTDPWGKDEALEKLGWYDKNSGMEKKEVGQKRPNAWGLRDMHGNVWEWCLDLHGAVTPEPALDPMGPETGQDRVLRGGGYWGGAGSCRSAYRLASDPSHRNQAFGFRLAAGRLSASLRGGRSESESLGEAEKRAAARGEARVGRVGLWDARALAPWPWEAEPEDWPEDRPAWAETLWRDAFGLAAAFHVEGVRFVFRQILPGRFQMGSPENEVGRYDDEQRHEVRLTRGFWLAETPTTQAQWQAVMGENPSAHQGERLPVESIVWEEARNYVHRLSQKIPDLAAQLPTEAEWEYACRAGTDTAFNDGSACTAPDGQDPALEDLGWYVKNSGDRTHPVGLKTANAWGLQDMHGNVWEWCSDWDGDYSGGLATDPQGPQEGRGRVLRGGGCWGGARGCRSAYRGAYVPSSRDQSFGFRLAAGHFLASSRRRSESEEGRSAAGRQRSGSSPVAERGTSDETGDDTPRGEEL